ncbi:hypothetical protein AKO1_009416 [Acrasis kona]|uniref:ATP-dependent RNA helicase n=1 Tax=Acrasis kona TaxID=1008807 RepID=A0AAW2ZKJ9_9EUKA
MTQKVETAVKDASNEVPEPSRPSKPRKLIKSSRDIALQFLNEQEDIIESKKTIKPQDVKKGNVWMMGSARVSLENANLNPKVVAALKSMNVTELFAVQRAVVPVVIALSSSGSPGDICVGSPTGSGKTLSYVIPIQQILSTSRSTKLRAIVIVPTRQLASQVHHVFSKFEPFTNKKCALLNGTLHFNQEQEQLLSTLTNGELEWKVDVVVGTAQRLLQHVKETPGFSLEHLRFIVMDEVDVLLSEDSVQGVRGLLDAYHNHPVVARKHYRAQIAPDVPLPVPHLYARKILCSATLTAHAGKSEEARLFRPQYFTHTGETSDVGSTSLQFNTTKYAVPTTLRQHMVTYDPNYKPLYLITLLIHPKIKFFEKDRRILCFVDKNSTAKRLSELINMAHQMNVIQTNAPYDPKNKICATFETNFKNNQREAMLKQFEKGYFKILMCSDVMGRGIDIDVDTVINYDAPTHLKTYIHRVGRTARAGKKGFSFTLLENEEVEHFKKKLESRVQMSQDITEYAISIQKLESIKDAYKNILLRMKKGFKRGTNKLVLQDEQEPLAQAQQEQETQHKQSNDHYDNHHHHYQQEQQGYDDGYNYQSNRDYNDDYQESYHNDGGHYDHHRNKYDNQSYNNDYNNDNGGYVPYQGGFQQYLQEKKQQSKYNKY